MGEIKRIFLIFTLITCGRGQQPMCSYEEAVQMAKDDLPGEILAQIRIKHVQSLKRTDVDDREFMFKYDIHRKPGGAFPRSPINDLFTGPVLQLTVNDPEGFGSIQEGCAANKGCDPSQLQKVDKDTLKQYADVFVQENKAPGSTGDLEIDKKLAYGISLIKFGFLDDAIHTFSEILKGNSKVAGAYYGRGVAFARKNLKLLGEAALDDFAKAVELEPNVRDIYERRAEVYIAIGRLSAGLQDIRRAGKIKVTANQYFLRGHVEFLSGDLHLAEKNFRRSLILDDDKPSTLTMFHLAMTLYLRGKMRNSAEVYKDILKLEDNVAEVYASLSEVYREIGLKHQALEYLNKSLNLEPDHLLSLQVLASLHYQTGNIPGALEATKRCLSVSASSSICQYIEAMALTTQGRFYEGVKAATKVIVYHRPNNVVRASSEFVKAHYMKEYARYLHSNLEEPIAKLDIEGDFTEGYRNSWARGEPMLEKGYIEQPGIQPHISDVLTPKPDQYTPEVQELICKAARVGNLTQPVADGYMENTRSNLAMGLAALQIAQMAEKLWLEDIPDMEEQPANMWMKLMNIAIQYRRLVFPDQVILWMDELPYQGDMKLPDTHFIRGQTMNVHMASYFDVVFKLAKTMILHYYGGKDAKEKAFLKDFEKAETPEDIIDMSRRHDMSQNGFVVSTEVPTMKSSTPIRIDGPVLTLTGEGKGKVLFNINCMNSRARSNKYIDEITHIVEFIRMSVRESGMKKAAESDGLITMVITMAYYMYNWMPLSRGTSLVTYTMTVGMIMSLGREITSKMPDGKLFDIEAMLAGAPDIYTTVFKQWVTIKKLKKPIPSYPSVSQTFPTLRHVLEVLNMGAAWCPKS